MTNGQRVWLSVFLVGLGAFFYFGGEILARHSDWAEFRTPAGVGEVFGLGASVVMAIAGALGLKTELVTQFFRRKE